MKWAQDPKHKHLELNSLLGKHTINVVWRESRKHPNVNSRWSKLFLIPNPTPKSKHLSHHMHTYKLIPFIISFATILFCAVFYLYTVNTTITRTKTKHVGLGPSVCVNSAVCFVDARIVVSNTWTVKMCGVWKFSDKWCFNTHSLSSLFWFRLHFLPCY